MNTKSLRTHTNSQIDFKQSTLVSEFQLREVFNRSIVQYISDQISQVLKSFDGDGFVITIMQNLETLSFGDRSSLITDTLETYLPDDKREAIEILRQSLGPEIEGDEISGYDSFYIMPLGNFVSRHGVPHFDLSMEVLYEMTKRFTAEGPIRTFLRDDSKRVFTYLDKWVLDPNPHVRRLVSEGTRPRLPLSSPLREFIEHPERLEKYLDQLKRDPALYVRRSVANNMNDISKDNPDYICEVLSGFNQTNKHERWITKHALRTLLKQAFPPALSIIGYTVPPQFRQPLLTLQQSTIPIGTDLSFNFKYTSDEDQKLVIHYVIHYMKANGKTKPKVFILRDGDSSKGEHSISKTQSFKQMSTRKHYPGFHQLEIRINGDSVVSAEFNVI